MLNNGAGLDPARLFAPFDLTTHRAVIAAISGGSDSTALLLLLKSFLEAAAPDTRLVAVTVDHGLRPDSAAEAEAVAALCSTHGISHQTIAWSGPKPGTGLPAAARAARYRLLGEAASMHGANVIMTGHTADDQAETVLMRQARRDGRGLAGMAPATLLDGRFWIVRPLLAIRREALRDWLRRRNATWLEDPTNRDASFERPRRRAELGAGSEREARVTALLDVAATAALAREALGMASAALIQAHATLASPGLVRIDPDFATAHDRAAAVYALRILLAATGGTPHLPDAARAAALLAHLAIGRSSATLSRTLVEARPGGIFLRRESRGLPPPAAPVDGMIWDGRRRIALPGAPDDAIVVTPFGVRNARSRPVTDGVPEHFGRAAMALEPALWHGAECLGLLSGTVLGDRIAGIPVAGPWAGFLPSFDLAPARATAALIGAPPPPRPPFTRHNAPYSKA